MAGLWLLFEFNRILVNVALTMQINPWFPRAVENWGFFLLGLIWIVLVMTAEGRLRQSVAQERLLNVSMKFLGTEIALAAIIFVNHWWIQ